MFLVLSVLLTVTLLGCSAVSVVCVILGLMGAALVVMCLQKHQAKAKGTDLRQLKL